MEKEQNTTIGNVFEREIFQRLYYEYNEDTYERFYLLEQKFQQLFHHNPLYWFSTPGRTELLGNHTDHNRGIVLAGSIHLDAIAAVSAIPEDNKIIIQSQGFDELFTVNIHELELKEIEKGTTVSLIKGILKGFINKGFQVGSFRAVINSRVMIGSGLSSSACFEIMISNIINVLFNDSRISMLELAKISKWSENEYFGKPCGLMDQLACALGGISYIDFQNEENPIIESIDYSFQNKGYQLLVIDSGDNHADLTDDYSEIPYEMKQAADFFQAAYCRDIPIDLFWKSIPALRKAVGDRAVLRVVHFFMENERVIQQRNALKKDLFHDYLKNVQASGKSSMQYLQNIISQKNIHEQGLNTALALTDIFIQKQNIKGAYRVHGGGFAGTIQAYLPTDQTEQYQDWMRRALHLDNIQPLKIRPLGAVCLNAQ